MSRSGLVSLTLLVIAILAIALFVFYFFFSRSKIDQLTRSLNETKEQVQNVGEESEEARREMAMEASEGIKSTAEAIKDVENPAVRLALIKAYAAQIRPLLTGQSQEDLDTVLVYIDKNPAVLVTKNPSLPQEVVLAINNLKTRARNLRIAGVATMQKVDEVLYTQGETVELMGTIAFVQDDPALGGSVFTLTDSETGYVYYLVFNEANSATIKEDMVNQEVEVTVRVTSRAYEPLTFQVVSGPTLAAQPTQGAQSTPAPTEAAE
jgi:hypothetical protein